MIYGIEAASRTQMPAAPPGGGGSAIHLGNSAYLRCSSLSCTDNGFFSFSMWEKGLLNTANASKVMFAVNPAVNYNNAMTNGGSNNLVMAFNNAGNYYDRFWTGLNAYDASAYAHLLFCVDLNHAVGAKISALYVNDTLVSSSSLYEDGVSFNTVFNGQVFSLGTDGGYSPAVDLADVWIAPGVNLLSGTTIPEATRRQFINADLTPTDPAGFPTSAILFTGGASTFPTNLGTGGSFTLTGSLTDATPP